MDDGMLVLRSDLDRRVFVAGGRATDQERHFISSRCISLATWTISSRLGVISPERPMMSTPVPRRLQDFLAGTMTPKSMTS